MKNILQKALLKAVNEKVVTANSDAVRVLITTLHQTLGSKRYLHDLEELFNEKLTDLEARDEETIYHLIRDLKELG